MDDRSTFRRQEVIEKNHIQNDDIVSCTCSTGTFPSTACIHLPPSNRLPMSVYPTRIRRWSTLTESCVELPAKSYSTETNINHLHCQMVYIVTKIYHGPRCNMLHVLIRRKIWKELLPPWWRNRKPGSGVSDLDLVRCTRYSPPWLCRWVMLQKLRAS